MLSGEVASAMPHASRLATWGPSHGSGEVWCRCSGVPLCRAVAVFFVAVNLVVTVFGRSLSGGLGRCIEGPAGS